MKKTKKPISWKKIIAKCVIYFVLLLLYLPLIYITVYSFTNSDTTGVWTGFSFNTYKTLFNSNNAIGKKIWSAAGNTMLVAFLAALLATVLGTLGAIGMFNLKKKPNPFSFSYLNLKIDWLSFQILHNQKKVLPLKH